MKWEETKSWPYPVLRPRSGDYQKAEFQVTIDPYKLSESTEVKVNFNLSEPELRRLVEKQQAKYLLLVQCSTTHYRQQFSSSVPDISLQFPDGDLAGLTTFSPYIIAVEKLSKFSADRWHTDYRNTTVNLEPGAVLALDRPETYWIDTAEEQPVTSMFRVAKGTSLPEGQWRCVLQQECIELQLNEREYNLFNDARSRVAKQSELAYLLNGVYLPAVIWLLMKMDQRDADGDYGDYRWYEPLNRALNNKKGKALGADGADRVADAQALLDQPFLKMPILNPEQMG